MFALRRRAFSSALPSSDLNVGMSGVTAFGGEGWRGWPWREAFPSAGPRAVDECDRISG